MRITSNNAFALDQDWRDLLCTPAFVLHSINVKAGLFDFLPASAKSLNELSFLDGRAPLSKSDQVFSLPIAEVLEWHLNQQASHPLGLVAQDQPNRYIFHMSFCGSTLMARSLHRSNRSFCYKEPQILMQLAEIKAKENIFYRNRAQWKALLGFVLGQFRLQWKQGESTIIKPSNWLNTMLPELMLDAGQSRAVLLSISPQAFLTSIFRGGGERVQFMYSVLRHLKTAFPEYSKIISEVEASSEDTVYLFARLSLITHAIQAKAFARIGELLPEQSVYFCDYQKLVGNPQAELRKSAEALRLDLNDDEIMASIEDNFSKHSKVNYRGFDKKQSAKVNNEVMSAYKDKFEMALQWADQHLEIAYFT